MRLTIVNLFDFGANGRGTERPASILARKPGKMNPPYAGGRTAADAAYKISAVKEARRSLVVCARVRKPPPQPSPASGRKRERGQTASCCKYRPKASGSNTARLVCFTYEACVFPDTACQATQRAPSPACGGGLGWGLLRLKLHRHFAVPHRRARG